METRRTGVARAGRDAPMWSRRPLVLLRYPRLLVSLAVGALLVVVAIAAYPLFISSISAGLVAGEISEPLITRYGAGVWFSATNQPLDDAVPGMEESRLQARDRLFDRLTREPGVLGPPVASILGPEVVLDSPDDRARTFEGRLAFSTGAPAHLDVLRGDPDGPPGAWIPSEMAGALHLSPGETVTVQTRSGATAELPVAGVHANLYSAPRRGYWLQWATEIYPSYAHCDGPCDEPLIPPQFVLVDRATMLEALDTLDERFADVGWQAPLRAGARLTISEARDLQRFVSGLRERMRDRGTEVGSVFQCCERQRVRYRTASSETSLVSRIGLVVRQVEERVVAIETPGRVLQIAGLVVALSVLAGAGSFSVAARSTEGRLLFARGMSPIRFGVRSSFESALPAVVGGAAGLAGTYWLVTTVGPGGPVAAEHARVAIIGSLTAVGAAIVAVGIVSAASYHARFEHRSGWLGMAARFPWELLLLGAAFFSFARLTQGAALVEEQGVRRPGLYLLLFPLAFLGGASGLGARLLRGGFGRLADRAGRVRSSLYLAIHRLAAGSLVTVLLVASAGLSLGLFLYSRTVVRSLEDTVEAKSHIFTGGDVRAWVTSDRERPEGFPFPATRVTRVRDAGTLPGRTTEFDLLAVDPATFASAASWDDRFASEPFDDLVARLGPTEGPLPLILAGAGDDVSFDQMELQNQSFPVSIVGRASAFPGMLGHRALVVAPSDGLEASLGGAPVLDSSNAHVELWFRGPSEGIVDAISRFDLRPFSVITADEVADIPYVAAVVQTFLVLNSLSLAAAILVVAALLMYLEARQRSQLVSYGLSVKMGMPPGSQAWSLTVEIGAMLVGALALGAAGGLAAAYLLGPHLDPLGSIPPGPLFTPPVPLVGVVLVALLAVAWVGGWLTERRARRVPLGEVMRVADA